MMGQESIIYTNIQENIFYNNYKKNIYSQNGEDGIIEELLKRLSITNGYVCEFGAWDGKNLSNTFNLIQNKDFYGVFIEGDPAKFTDLLITAQEYKKITPICAYVDYDKNSDNILDKLLSKTNIPIDFDILSIDIDSYDYQVWDSLEIYKPKLVIIEINTTISPNITDWIHSPGLYEGTSFLPMYHLGVKKGYTFVVHTGNMFFIRNDLYSIINLND